MEKESRWYHAQVIANWLVAIFASVTTWVGCQQYFLLREANRPTILAAFDGSMVTLPQVGQPMKFGLVLINSGKAATAANIRGTILYSTEQLDAPPLPDAESRVLVWTTGRVTQPIEGSQSITEGNIKDMRGGQGYLYISAHVRYGREGQYYSAICSERKLKPTAEGAPQITLGPPELCRKPDANSTD